MSASQKIHERVDASKSYLALELLKTLKKSHDYKTLSQLTGIPVSTMTRYINGRTIPRGRRVSHLLARLTELVDVEKIVRERVKNGPDGFDITSAISDDYILRLVTASFASRLMASQVSTILAVDEPGIALATALGLMLGKRFYFASERQLWHDEMAVSVKYIIGESGERRILWIPRDALKSRKSTLITAGVVSHPALFKAIHRVVTESGGYLSGICAIASTATALQELKPHLAGERNVILAI